MGDDTQRLAMAASHDWEIALLPRDPDRAYVYWECPPDEGTQTPPRIALQIRTEDGDWEVVDEFAISESLGGQFIDFERHQTAHRCQLICGHERAVSDPLVPPPREAGNRPPRFVRVTLTDQGLQLVPTDHEHPVHGLFSAATSPLPSSTSAPNQS